MLGLDEPSHQTTGTTTASTVMNATEFLAGSNDASSQHYLHPNNDNDKQGTHKKKSMERISKLFQKKTKKQSIGSSLSSSLSSISLSSPSFNDSQSNVSLASIATNNTATTRSARQRSSSIRMPIRIGPDSYSSNDMTTIDCPSLDMSSPESQSTSLKEGDGRTDDRSSHEESGDYHQVAPLKALVAQQKRILEGLKAEHQQYEQSIQMLTEQLASLTAKREQRKANLQELQANYDKHLRSLRATGDDLESVRDKIEDLKKDMGELAAALVAKADVDVATQALSTFWLNLNSAIKAMCPLTPQRLQMLTEKFMMDVLVQNLNLSVFPGLDIIEEYNMLQYWLDDHNNNCEYYSADDAVMQLPVRLRQEVALIVHKTEMDKTSDVYKARHIALQNNWKYLYSGLVKAYPFVYQHDKAEPDVHKHYGARVQMLVEKAISLGLAIKGMEEDITAAAVMEGEQPFDPDTMVDEDCQKTGTVAFCICPPFVVGNIEPVRTLLKGRVLCVPLSASKH